MSQPKLQYKPVMMNFTLSILGYFLFPPNGEKSFASCVVSEESAVQLFTQTVIYLCMYWLFFMFELNTNTP